MGIIQSLFNQNQDKPEIRLDNRLEGDIQDRLAILEGSLNRAKTLEVILNLNIDDRKPLNHVVHQTKNDDLKTPLNQDKNDNELQEIINNSNSDSKEFEPELNPDNPKIQEILQGIADLYEEAA